MFDFLTNRRRAVHTVLTDCCLQRLDATVMSPTIGLVTNGQFQSLDASSVLIRFQAGHSPLLSEPLSCVSFHYKGRPRVFFSSISGVINQPHRDIAFALPEEVSTAERRHSIRIAATDEDPIRVRIRSECGEILGQGRVVNLSLGGVLVDFPSPPRSLVGSSATITLDCTGESVSIRCKAVRQDHHGRCAFGFETPFDDASRSSLVRILQRLEDTWAHDRATHSGDRVSLTELISTSAEPIAR